MEKLFSSKEAAEHLKMSSKNVWILCSKGKLKGAQKIGRNWIIPESAIKKYQPVSRGRKSNKQKDEEIKREFLESIKNIPKKQKLREM
jgi:hypothetical protein